jgi:hypothetical protein
MNSGTQPPEEPSQDSGGQGGATVNATIGLERDCRHRLRWWTLAVVPVSLLWPREGRSGVPTMIGRVTQVQEGRP